MKVSDLHRHPQRLSTAQAEEPLEEAADRMHWHQVGAHTMLALGVRHLPVVRRGRLVGVLSIRDLLGADGGRR
jgi:CBS domain-containing protein